MSTRLTKSAPLTSVLLLALVAGCSGDPLMPNVTQPPEAVTAVMSVPAGAASIDLVLTNRSVKSWEFGGCSHSLDRKSVSLLGWHTIHDGRQMLCTAVGYSLRAGESVTIPVPLPPESGTYRIRFDFAHFPNDRVEHVEVTSNEFTVGVVAVPAAR